MRRLWAELGPFLGLMAVHWPWLALGTLLGFLAVAAASGLLALAGWFIIAAALAGQTPESAHLFNFFLPSIGVRLLAITRTAARYGERLFAHDAVFRVLAHLRLWVYRGLAPRAPACFQEYRRGDLLSRFIADIDLLDNLYLRIISPSLILLLLALLAGGGLGWLHPGLGLLAAGGLLFSAGGLGMAAGLGGEPLGHSLNRALTELRSDLVERFQALSEVLIFQGVGNFQAAMARRQMRLLAAQARLSRLNALATALATLAGGLTVSAVLYLGLRLVEAGILNSALLGLMVLGTLALFEALMPLPGAFLNLGQTRAAARRLLEIKRRPPTVTFPDRPLTLPETIDLRFADVAFRYGPQEPWALSNINLTIAQGSHVALFGTTGAGKSTLRHLLARFWDPTQGVIELGGRDLRHYSEAQLRRMMTVVPQQPHFFNATLRKNLTLAQPEAGDEALWTALGQVQLAEFVESLPRKLETWIGEGGQLISGGQARRLALARAVLWDAPLWILDEPTEGLDPATESTVLETVQRLTQQKTLILITHRPVGLAGMQRVLWLEQGRLAADDTPARLKTHFPPFAALFQRWE